MIKSGLETMEIAKEIETSEFLRPWRWYAGALQQYHYATLMLVEVAAYPERDYVMRAWESLDWIFEVPSCVPFSHKARWVLEGAVEVCKEYRKARKLRCPTVMDERLGIAPSSPLSPTSPKRRKAGARTTKTATMAHSGRKDTSRSGQSHVNSRGTCSGYYCWTLADKVLLGGELSQLLVMSNMRASLQDMAMTSGAQAMTMDGVAHKSTEQSYTDRVGRQSLGLFA